MPIPRLRRNIFASSHPEGEGTSGSPSDASSVSSSHSSSYSSPDWTLRRNVTWMILAETFNRIIPLVVLSRATRALGMEGFGQAQFLLNVLESAIPWIAFGYTYVGLLAHQESERNRRGATHEGALVAEFTAISLLRLFNAAIVITVTVLLLWSQPKFSDSVLPFLWFSPFLLFSALDPSYLFLAKGEIGKFTRVTTFAKAIFYMGALFVITGPEDKWWFVFCMMAVNATTMAVGLWSAFRHVQWWPQREGVLGSWGQVLPWAKAKRLMAQATPFAVLLGLMPLYERAEVFAVERFFVEGTSGSFQALFKLQQSALGVVTALMTPFLAEFARSTAPDRTRRLLELALLFGAFVASSAFVFSVFFGDDFLRLFFGSVSPEGAVVFELLMLSLFPAVLVTVFGMQVLALFGGKPWVALALILGALLPHVLVVTFSTVFVESLARTVALYLGAKVLVSGALLVLGLRKIPIRRGFAVYGFGLAGLLALMWGGRQWFVSTGAIEPVILWSAGALSLLVLGAFFGWAALTMGVLRPKSLRSRWSAQSSP